MSTRKPSNNNNNRQRQRGGGGNQQRTKAKATKAVDLWRPVPAAPVPDDITPAADPTAVLRSLGNPPLAGQGTMADRHFALVIARAAGVATALAAAADLLSLPDQV